MDEIRSYVNQDQYLFIGSYILVFIFSWFLSAKVNKLLRGWKEYPAKKLFLIYTLILILVIGAFIFVLTRG